MSGLALAAEAAPGTHTLTPVCGDGSQFVSLVALKFYYCGFTLDTLGNSGLAILLTVGIVLLIARRVRHGVPGKLQMLLELLLDAVKSLTHETVAEDAGFIIPIAATIGLYVLIANWISFFPVSGLGFHPANADLNQTLAMSMVVILIVQAYSLRVLGPAGYLRRFTRPFELPLLFRILFIPLNIIEEIAKPVTLALRLFGNIFAGLLMVYLIGQLFGAGVTGAGAAHLFAPMGILFLTIWKGFDVFFVGTIQAFIFMLLTIIYFGMAREGLEEEEHHRPEPATTAPTRGRPQPAPAPAHPQPRGGV